MASLIIVSGPSASGKSTLADRLSADLHLPVIHRDRIKEALFDSLGYSDRERSKQFGSVSALVLIRIIENFLRNGTSCIIEAKFNPKFSGPEFVKLSEDTGATMIQIQCSCEGNVLYERFKQRALSPERHPGHDEASHLDDFKDELLAGKLAPLELLNESEVLEYDTTERNESRYEELVRKVQSRLKDL